MAPLSRTHIKNTTVIGLSEKVLCRAASFIKSMYTRYSSVSDMLDELGWPPLSLRRQEVRIWELTLHWCASKIWLQYYHALDGM